VLAARSWHWKLSVLAGDSQNEKLPVLAARSWHWKPSVLAARCSMELALSATAANFLSLANVALLGFVEGYLVARMI